MIAIAGTTRINLSYIYVAMILPCVRPAIHFFLLVCYSFFFRFIFFFRCSDFFLGLPFTPNRRQSRFYGVNRWMLFTKMIFSHLLWNRNEPRLNFSEVSLSFTNSIIYSVKWFIGFCRYHNLCHWMNNYGLLKVYKALVSYTSGRILSPSGARYWFYIQYRVCLPCSRSRF